MGACFQPLPLPLRGGQPIIPERLPWAHIDPLVPQNDLSGPQRTNWRTFEKKVRGVSPSLRPWLLYFESSVWINQKESTTEKPKPKVMNNNESIISLEFSSGWGVNFHTINAIVFI